MKTLSNFFYENEIGNLNQIHIGYNMSLYPIYEIDFDKKSYKTKNLNGKINLLWRYNDNWIKIESESSITGYPTVDLKYVVAIYQNSNGKFKPPGNAVIYNLDGTTHKILVMPELLSTNILKRIEYNKESNPPLESAKFEGGLYFSGFDWGKNQEGQIINRIQIIYDRDWIEWRELNSETGEIGKYIGQGRL